MKHLKLTFVGLLALASAASDAFAFGPPPGPPMGGPPMGGGLPRGPMGPPMGAQPMGGRGPAGNVAGNIAAPAPWEMSPGMVRQAVREMAPAPGITLAATPSITMEADTMVADTDTMATDAMVTDAPGAHMRPEPRQERQPLRATGRQRPITITPGVLQLYLLGRL